MTTANVDALYSLLVSIAHAPESERADFIRYHTERAHPHSEWRFRGALGFGGKLYRTPGRMWVDCYPGDRTAERAAVIREVNARIAAMVGERV